MNKLPIKFNNVDAFIFDCDGVLTNNCVYVDEHGKETVRFSRADGLAFNALRKLDKPTYILSSEKNPVVSARAKKLRIDAIQGVEDKMIAIEDLAMKNNFDIQQIVYVGNDINDYDVLRNVGISVCPSDSHDMVKSISLINLYSKGGEGIVRELLERVFDLNLKEILF